MKGTSFMKTNGRLAAGIAGVLLGMAAARAEAQVASKAGWTDQVPRREGAAEYFISPEGKPENQGTAAAPWDLLSTLAGDHKVPPGSILWVRGGTYQGKPEINKGKILVMLGGKESAPIHVRAYPGERATILDTALMVMQGTKYLWFWDLEITSSVPPEKRVTKQSGSHPTDLPGGDGINVYYGEGTKFINLVIHDNVGGGVGWWVDSTDSEFHGCLIYGNGWTAPDRGHGHSIYVQNNDGTKTVSNCILSAVHEGQYTMHAYGSSAAYIHNLLLQDNIAFERGPFLVGGGRPSHTIKVFRNYLYGVNMQIGSSVESKDCEVRDNFLAKGKLAIGKYEKVVDEGNGNELPDRKAVLIPNRYDPRRAHLAVYNGAKAAQVAVDVSAFLKPGEAFRLMDSRDFFGKPVLSGTCSGATISVPMAGEFSALVLLKEAK
jgi:parallel beta helix pectate lyase-like protein